MITITHDTRFDYGLGDRYWNLPPLRQAEARLAYWIERQARLHADSETDQQTLPGQLQECRTGIWEANEAINMEVHRIRRAQERDRLQAMIAGLTRQIEILTRKRDETLEALERNRRHLTGACTCQLCVGE